MGCKGTLSRRGVKNMSSTLYVYFFRLEISKEMYFHFISLWIILTSQSLLLYFLLFWLSDVVNAERHFRIRVRWQSIYVFIVARSPTNASCVICDSRSQATSIDIWGSTSSSNTNKCITESSQKILKKNVKY